MKIRRITALILAAVMLAAVLAACGTKTENDVPQPTEEATTEEEKNVPVNVSVLKGPTGMQTAYLMHSVKADEYDGINEYNFRVETDPQAVAADLMSGKTDIAAIPSNTAAVLFKKTNGKIRIIATNTANVLSLVAKSDSVTDFDSLKGKTILSSGKGTSAQYVTEKILKDNGIDPVKDVTIEYVAEHAETVTKAKSGLCEIAVLPEPFATQLILADAGFERVEAFTMAANSADSGIVTGVFAVRSDFAEAHPKAVAQFLADGLASHTFITASSDVCAQYIEEADIMPAAVAAKSIPSVGFRFRTGEEMKEMCGKMFGLLYSVNPESIGGEIPGEEIYY